MAENQTADGYVVVVGASAGGVDALQRLFRTLPSSFPAPIVVALHHTAASNVRLEEVLSERAAMPVQLLDGQSSLKPGNIYLAPAGRATQLFGDGSAGASVSEARHPSPSIDGLFTYAARTYGEAVIAVILSGTGTDGAAGVREVKDRGGTVVVQEPESAAFPALPASIPPNYIDLVGDVETIASLLRAITEGETFTRELNDPEVLRAFLSQLRARSGIDFRQYKTPTISRRLARLMVASRSESLADYLRFLNANPDAYQRLVSSFLIKVTGFFRDPALFDYLRETVLPALIHESRERKRELRIWSAGCATGEEAYSVAILLAELLGDEVEQIPLRIFATDLDAEAITFARKGVYPENALDSMSKELIEKYFTKLDGAYQVKKRIRNLVVFGEYDLGQRAPFPAIDLVLCRNVLIYFTKELQQRTLQLFAFSLRSGGYLVLGKAETVSPLPNFFAAIDDLLKIYRREGERLLIPGRVAKPPVLPERASLRRHAVRANALPRTSETSPRWSLTDRLGAFLFDSPIGIVVVDRNYDIQTINQSARTGLGIHGQGIGEDLIHLASDVPALELKNAVDSAFRSEMPTGDEEFEVFDKATNESRFVQLSCYPDKSAGEDGRIERVLLTIIDVTRVSKRRRIAERESEEQRASLRALTAQRDELLSRQRALMDANDELTSKNDELRSTNEQLLIAAEEAEASAEEVETLNEEMQATSEELETLNEELQATVEELNTTNEELEARSSELERVAQERLDLLAEMSKTADVLGCALRKMPGIASVADASRRIIAATEEYLALAGGSHGRIPAVGESWYTIPTQIDVADATFTPKLVDIFSDGVPSLLIVLERKTPA